MASVSVVIPCYRCAGTVAMAVRSAIDQSLPPREIILVDDASPDGTRQVLESLQREFGADFVRIIALEDNRGPATARNAGWQAAQGELVAFLDADDAWHRRKLEVQTRFMRDHAEFALTGHLHSLSDNGPEADAGVELRYAEFGLEALLFGNRFNASSVMLRRGLPQRFPEGRRHGEDYFLWLEIAAAGYRIARIESVLLTRFNPMFGGSGLSGALWTMEKAELCNYRRLHKQRVIGTLMLGVLGAWSLARFARRVAIVALRRRAA